MCHGASFLHIIINIILKSNLESHEIEKIFLIIVCLMDHFSSNTSALIFDGGRHGTGTIVVTQWRYSYVVNMFFNRTSPLAPLITHPA